ncbi:MAG: DUF4139 domain-containing protein [Planctomycetes bacterium]|jgi:hypothetical protein|nr:DUF4139 domain-containing protein [Planctomycetota bacterium]MCL4729726.1 DUF4139 domain-containing protein [Planctomycetota bacterium]
MKLAIATLVLLVAAPLCAKEELVTLPKRDSVQLTIYNSEDLTLVRERRTLSFKQGSNRLQFSWANTLIDPTSVELMPVGDAARAAIDVADTSYPAESHEMLIWTISCKTAGSYPVEISYFTSGITWQAEYTGLVNPNEDAMTLTAYVTVTNNSGEEYEDAQVRLVVGTINLVEKIINLAQPRPQSAPRPSREDQGAARDMDRMARGRGGDEGGGGGMVKPKEIIKGGLSEYYIYTVEGQETIPNRWSKRLRSFEVAAIPLKTVYRLEPAKFGPAFTKVLEFKNDEEHKLGKEPLPDGLIRLYKDHGQGRLGYMGALASKYIPKKDEVKVNVGPDAECTLAIKRISLRKKDLTFQNGWLSGWTTVEEFEMEVKNFRGRAVEAEIHRSMQGDYDFESADGFVVHDAATRKVTLKLEANSTRKLRYTVTTRQGSNARK